MKYFNTLKTAGAIALASSFTFNANAAFLTLDANGGFSEATLGNGNSATLLNETAPGSGLFLETEWGFDNGNGLSSLVLNDYEVDIENLGQNYLLSELTHVNRPINGGVANWLASALITGVIDISSTGVGGIGANFYNDTVLAPFDTQILTLFGIQFTESSNQFGSVNDCVAVDEDGDPGTIGDHVNLTVCDDYFDYSIDNQGLGPNTLPFSVPFVIDGLNYALTVFSTTDAAGQNLIPNNRFFTPEMADTTIYTFVNLQRVPEPLTVAVMGLGLIGLGAMKRRKKA